MHVLRLATSAHVVTNAHVATCAHVGTAALGCPAAQVYRAASVCVVIQQSLVFCR
jgi:hypothetical protein